MIYSYRCSIGHAFEENFPIGEAPTSCICWGCNLQADRDYATDFAHVTIAPVDPFRSYDLSSAKSVAEGVQQRNIDAPRDSFERKHLEKSLGRTYIGNDYGTLRPAAQKSIKAHQESQK